MSDGPKTTHFNNDKLIVCTHWKMFCWELMLIKIGCFNNEKKQLLSSITLPMYKLQLQTVLRRSLSFQEGHRVVFLFTLLFQLR